MPFLKTPYFITASQYDSWQLRFDVCNDLLGCEIPSEALPYVDTYGKLLQQYMNALPQGSLLKNRSAIYSQACYNHHMSESDLFNSTFTSEGVSENEALRQYLTGAVTHDGMRWIDECQGYNCGSGCSGI